MTIGRFLGGIAALIFDPRHETYLLLRRSPQKDVGAGHRECVTGRVDQGEGFYEAAIREVKEEIGVEFIPEFVVGTTHFYRGEAIPENELIGVMYCGVLADEADADHITISEEHSTFEWVTAEQAREMLEKERWLLRLIERAETMRRLMLPELREFYRHHQQDI